MDESEAKENRPVTPLNKRDRGSGPDVVGSGSTWGAKERERFRIKTGDVVDVRVFVENKWFDFSTLDETQRKRIVAFLLSNGSDGNASIGSYYSFEGGDAGN